MKMIRILFMFALVFAVGTSYGQIKVMGSGSVGIGTSNPASKLEVAGSIRISGPQAVASVVGNVGSKRFVFSPNINSQVSNSYFSMFGDETFTGGSPARAGEVTFAGAYCVFRTGVDQNGFGNERMRLTESGLTVNGTVTANGVVLDRPNGSKISLTDIIADQQAVINDLRTELDSMQEAVELLQASSNN